MTGATIGLLIAGGAYVSTVDEATFWYIWEFDVVCILIFLFNCAFNICNFSFEGKESVELDSFTICQL